GRLEPVPLDRLEARSRPTEPAVHLVARDPEDPNEQARVALEGAQRAEDRDEHFLRDVLGLARVSEALQREAVHAREVRVVEHVEVRAAAGEDLADELLVVFPGRRRATAGTA